MQFDDNAINSFKKIINDELAYGVFLHDWAIRKEIENHIAIQLFESPLYMKETLLKVLLHYIEKAKTGSIIGFTEDDPALTTVATWIHMKTNLPFYSYNMEDPGASSQFVRPEVGPCSLIIPYSSNDIQVNEIIKIFTDKMVPIKQVISMVEEHPLKTDFQKLNIDYVSIANWASILKKIKQFHDITTEKTTRTMSFFQSLL
jgi:hypothetical protein